MPTFNTDGIHDNTDQLEPLTQAVVNNTAALASRTNSGGDAVLVSGSKIKYRREFNDAAMNEWDVVAGDGMTVAANTGDLVVTTGVTANAVTTITSKQSFTAPFKAGFGFKISQKVAGVEFYAEVVAVNADGTLDETSVAAWRIAGTDSTTVTSARTEVRNGGPARLQSGNITSQASQTGSSVYEVTLESDEVWFHSRVADSTAGRSASQVRQTVSPDPNKSYKLRYRIVNAATPAVSSTTLTASHVSCVDYTEQQIEITGGTGSISPGQSIPVYSVGGVVTATVAATTVQAATTTTGLSVAKVNSLATTNASLVKTGAARVYAYHLSNTTALWRFVKFYNKATAPVVGTDVPIYTVPLAPNSSTIYCQTIPLSHALGLGIAITAGAADNDTMAVAASDVVGHIDYI
jgi:hypothetical protein